IIIKLDWLDFHKVKEFFKYLSKEQYTWFGGSRIYYRDTLIKLLISFNKSTPFLEVNLDTKECGFELKLKSTTLITMDNFMSRGRHLTLIEHLDSLDKLIEKKEKLMGYG